jgi:hypothetical protein
MRVLAICDDHYHPGSVLQEGLATFGQGMFELDWLLHAGEWSAARMAEYPVVLMAKSNNVSSAHYEPWVTDAVQDAFRDYVRGGKGIVFAHSGTAGYLDLPVMRGVIGGRSCSIRRNAQ